MNEVNLNLDAPPRRELLKGIVNRVSKKKFRSVNNFFLSPVGWKRILRTVESLGAASPLTNKRLLFGTARIF
jgi:hypothetical protein